MTLNDTDDVLWKKVDDLMRTEKSGVKINCFLSKFENIFISV